CPYVFDPDQAAAMARAGADVLVPHMGLTTSGTIGAQTALTLDACVQRVQAMRDAAESARPGILVLCHGGPIAEPRDAAYVLARIRPADVETFSFEWGTTEWFAAPVTIAGEANSQGEVIVNPGQGHARHQHDEADELIYVISGSGVQTVGDEEFTITEGDAVY